MWNKLKHLLHVTVFCLTVALLTYESFYQLFCVKSTKSVPENLIYLRYIIYGLQCLAFLNLPQVISNFLGLTLFNAFLGPITINDKKIRYYDSNLSIHDLNTPQYSKNSDSNIDHTDQVKSNKLANIPHICFRVVTRGLYPDLVKQNVNINYKTCIEASLENFSIEIVTDKSIDLVPIDELRIKQTVVPTSYKTSTGAMFKARALQYALEDQVNTLGPCDYIVHLDEETLLTTNSVNGIVNFILDGSHAFGQGLITYANQPVVNWITTMADSLRVADDMGKLRFQFKAFHKPIFGWKGSYVVTKCEAEKDVSFDHGCDGSIAEDCYFGIVAFSKGYSFDFIDGEMLEKSPFTLMDLIRQRKRWIQGIWLVVHSKKIPFRYKIILSLAFYGWITLPLTTLAFVAGVILGIPTINWINIGGSLCFAVTFYMYLFGLVKSFDINGNKFYMVFPYLIGQVMILLLNVVMENIAVLWAVFSSKHEFYIIAKDKSNKISLEI